MDMDALEVCMYINFCLCHITTPGGGRRAIGYPEIAIYFRKGKCLGDVTSMCAGRNLCPYPLARGLVSVFGIYILPILLSMSCTG